MLARLTGATSRAAGFVHGVAAILLLPYAGALAATPKAALAAVVLAAIGPGVARPKGVLVLRGSEAGARRGADNVGGGGEAVSGRRLPSNAGRLAHGARVGRRGPDDRVPRRPRR